MAFYRFFLLCPSTICTKCKRIIVDLNKIAYELNLDWELQIITDIDKQIKFDTWILPSLFINGNICCRGYIPRFRRLKEIIMEIIFMEI